MRSNEYKHELQKKVTVVLKILRPRQNERHFADDILSTWTKMFALRLTFHWRLFRRVHLTIFQHWFRKWLGVDQATSHYLNQWWLVYWRIYASLGLNELKLHMKCKFIKMPKLISVINLANIECMPYISKSFGLVRVNCSQIVTYLFICQLRWVPPTKWKSVVSLKVW